MNISESNDVQLLIRFLEHGGATMEGAAGALSRLSQRSSAALGAGYRLTADQAVDLLVDAVR